MFVTTYNIRRTTHAQCYVVCCVRPVDYIAMHAGISTCWVGFSFLSRPEPYISIPVNTLPEDVNAKTNCIEFTKIIGLPLNEVLT